MKIPRKHEKLTTKYWQLNQTRQLSYHYLNKDCGSQAVVRPIAISWWRHQMETFSALLVLCAGNSPVSSEFPAQRPVTRSFDVFFDLHLNKRLSKQSRGWWFETPSRSLWRHRNVSGRGPTWHNICNTGFCIYTCIINYQITLEMWSKETHFDWAKCEWKYSCTVSFTLFHTFQRISYPNKFQVEFHDLDSGYKSGLSTRIPSYMFWQWETIWVWKVFFSMAKLLQKAICRIGSTVIDDDTHVSISVCFRWHFLIQNGHGLLRHI